MSALPKQTLMEVKGCISSMKRWMKPKWRSFTSPLQLWRSARQTHTDIHAQVGAALSQLFAQASVLNLLFI